MAKESSKGQFQRRRWLEEDEAEGTVYPSYLFNNLPMVISQPQLLYMPSTADPQQPIKSLKNKQCGYS